MPHRSAASLQQPSLDGESGVIEVEKRRHRLDAIAIQQFGIYAVQAHGVAPPRVGVPLRIGMVEVQHAALAHHRVIVEVLLQPFPQLHGKFIERDIARQKIVRSHDRGVAANIAAADPAFFEHGDVPDPVLLGQIIGRGQSVTAAADHHHIVSGLRSCVAPLRRPVAVAAQRLLRKPQQGKAHHAFIASLTAPATTHRVPVGGSLLD